MDVAVQAASSQAPSEEGGVSCSVNRLDGDSFDIEVGPVMAAHLTRPEGRKLLVNYSTRTDRAGPGRTHLALKNAAMQLINARPARAEAHVKYA